MNFYYGLVDEANNAWGFLEETDPRAFDEEGKLKPTMIFLTAEEWQQILSEQSQGRQIVGYGGKCFTAEPGRYYVDAKGWHKKTDETFNKEKAEQKKEELVQTVYEIKSEKAYGGVIINNMLVFETNQTAITNTVASLALMGDTAKANWKFYTVTGEPYVQEVTKAQLAYIASFSQSMINSCFAVEGAANESLKEATVSQLIDDSWVETFVSGVQANMDAISNKIEITLGE